MADRQFALDGEKFSTHMLRDFHVPQPGAPMHFDRSTLLIGARGVGKTFLLRHRKATTHPEAHYINLQTTLNSLTEEGIGSGAVDLPQKTSAQVAAKSAALIACAVIEAIEKSNAARDPRLDVLSSLLPKGQINGTGSTSEAKRAIIATDLSGWPDTPSRSFAEALRQLNEVESFTLFLDRADDIPEPAVKLVLSLLDQSMPFKAVIAARPGSLQLVPYENQTSLIPGDHFDIVHIGVSPRAEEWVAYLDECIRLTMEKTKRPIPGAASIEWIARLARESTRNGIEYAQDAARITDPDERIRPMSSRRKLKLDTVAAALAEYSPDLHSVISRLERLAAERAVEAGFRSTIISISEMRQPRPIDRDQKLDRFLLSSLKVELLYLRSGVVWHPRLLENEYELLPILAWNGEDPSWLT